MPQRDHQFALAVMEPETLSLTTGLGDVSSAEVSMKGKTNGVLYAFAPATAFDPSDVISYRFQTSNDAGVTWQDAPADGYLPTWNQSGGNKVDVAPVSPYLQTAGFIGDGGHFRITFTLSVLAGNVDLVVQPIFGVDQTPFTGWSSRLIPGDGQP